MNGTNKKFREITMEGRIITATTTIMTAAVLWMATTLQDCTKQIVVMQENIKTLNEKIVYITPKTEQIIFNKMAIDNLEDRVKVLESKVKTR
jgi:hypothetical protein